MYIAIVDDNATNLFFVKEILRKAGYPNLLLAASAVELFDQLQPDSPHPTDKSVDLILMDMMMPEIDGIEACRRLQSCERLRDIPIIMVTALGDSEKLAEALDAGAIDYVMKPINKVELLARIRAALRLKYEKDWHIERDKKIRNELDLARQVQSSVLSLPLDEPGLKISMIYRPSFELAGDFYAWHRIDDHRVGVILLDMMGHGISSSLVCMYISSVLHDTITKLISPKAVILELNRYMNQLYTTDQYMPYYFTAVYLVIDTQSKKVQYVNAGHPPAIVLNQGEIMMLNSETCAVGLFEQMDVEERELQLGDDFRIFLYTDGLIESYSHDFDEGIEVLIGKIRDQQNSELDALKEQFLDVEDQLQSDDQCMVMIHVKS